MNYSFIFGVIIFFLGILFSITWHEFGHYIAAKKTGMIVKRFFVGFGPTVFSKVYNETEYGLKLIPFGGFCDILGMTNLEEIPKNKKLKAMYLQKTWKKVVVLLAGPLQNFILGFLLLIILALGWGLPNNDPPKIIVNKLTCVVDTGNRNQDCNGKKGPAEKAGILQNDEIIEINQKKVSEVPDVSNLINSMQEKSTIKIIRDGNKKIISIKPEYIVAENDKQKIKKAKIGVLIEYKFKNPEKSSAFSAVSDSLYFSKEIISNSVKSMIELPKKVPALVKSLSEDERDPETPISIYGASRIGGEVFDAGYTNIFILLLATLNFFLGLFNLLPILPLDGGHIVVTFYGKLKTLIGKMLNKNYSQIVDYSKLLGITYIIYLIMILYMALTLSADIMNPLSIF